MRKKVLSAWIADNGKGFPVPYLLNIVYMLLLIAAAPYLAYQSLRTGKYRQGWAAKFLGRVPRRNGQRPCLWLHAVSVGEVNLLAPLLRDIARRHPEWECVISTTTVTGMALACKKYADHTVFYCPLDFTWAVRRALQRIRPQVLVLAELELWPNLVRAARDSGARVAVINGRLSEHSFGGYRRIRFLVSRVLRQIDLIAAQDATYASRFTQLGAADSAVQITGSMKYDGAQTERNNPATVRLRNLAGIAADDVVFLAGSTQEPEEALALDAFGNLSPLWPQLRLILVPRHPERFAAVARLLDESGIRWQRRTALERDGADPAARVLLIDVVGELGAWWGTAAIAFVGGSLSNRGGQNMIEPAAYGAAVSFGPNTRNFRDIVAAMLARQAAVVVADGQEMALFVERCLRNRTFAAELGQRGQNLVREQLGATARTIDLLEALMSAAAQPSTRALRCAA